MEGKLPKKDLKVRAMVSWSIWNARNRFHFEEKKSMPSDILHGATNLPQEYQGLCRTSTSTWEYAKAHKGYSFLKFLKLSFSPLILWVLFLRVAVFMLNTRSYSGTVYVSSIGFEHSCKPFHAIYIFYLSLSLKKKKYIKKLIVKLAIYRFPKFDDDSMILNMHY